MNIVCLWWNNWCGKSGPKYVNKLYKSLQVYTTIPFEFYCFTDNPKALKVPTIEFEPKFRWNLNKYQIFAPEFNLEGRVIIFDLDLVMYDNIDDILNAEYEFACMRNFKGQKAAGGSLISTTVEYGRNLYDRINSESKIIGNITRGSECKFINKYIENPTFWQDRHKGIYSYKHNGIKKDCRILCFHGKPRPHEIGFI